MIFNIANSAPGVPFSAPLFTYTGTAPKLKYSGDNWEIAFTGNCTITFQRVNPSIDIFLVAGGAAGEKGKGSGTGSSANAIGGKGGNGGGYKTVQKSVATKTKYTITIGGSGKSTSAFGESVSSGAGKSGGSGAYQKGTSGNASAVAGTDGEYAFGTASTLFWPGYKYGAGGGGGGAFNGQYGQPAAWDEGAKGGFGYTVNSQERRGGGQGGLSTYATGKAGSANSGGGGGGGASDFSANYTNHSGGAGGSGIVIIRNHR